MSRVERGWVDHLAVGGTTPWHEFVAAGTRGPVGGPAWQEDFLPGAQQLELLRRLNLAGQPSEALRRHLLLVQPRGRGRPPLRLISPSDPPSGYGAPYVDPATLSAHELLRVAATVLAEELATAGVPESSPRVVRLRRTSYRLAGDPWLVLGSRLSLAATGYPPGGRSPRVLVLGRQVDQMIADCWVARCFNHGAPPWNAFRRSALAGSLPRRAELDHIVRTRVGFVGRARVAVVLEPTELRSAAHLPRRSGDLSGSWATVPQHAAELARRVTGALAGMVTPDRQADLVRSNLLTRLSRATGPAPAVGDEHLTSLREVAGRMSDAIRSSGVAVYGNLDSLAPAASSSTEHEAQSDDRALELALELLLDAGRLS
jgi:hypothetical protein